MLGSLAKPRVARERNAVRAIPKPPYKIEPLDALFVQLGNPLPNEPLSGTFSVDPEGTINLGPSYGGSVSVNGLTIPEAKAAVEAQIIKVLKEPQVTVSLAQSRASQRIGGPHLVRPDGTVGLGTYGDVRVVGLTLAETKKAIEDHLKKYLQNPEVSVDVGSYNSKLYYVILDGGGAGQQVIRLPITGNEHVLDAISQVNGLTPVSSQDHIWVARPAPKGGPHQVLPVDWKAVAELGDTTTNYQIMPGDRVYVDAQDLVTIDIYLTRLFAPIERVLGLTLLGSSAARNISGRGVRNGSNNNNGGF